MVSFFFEKTIFIHRYKLCSDRFIILCPRKLSISECLLFPMQSKEESILHLYPVNTDDIYNFRG